MDKSNSATISDLPFRLGNYELTQRLARGGMGVVYQARHVVLDRPAAVKVLREDIPNRQSMVSAFQREAQALAKLSHPTIVHVHDVGEIDGKVFIAMELVPGMDLARWVKRDGRLALHNLLHVSKQVIEAFAAAHQAGVLHRDIKADNIIADHTGSVKVTDFGLAGDVRLVSSDKLRFATPAYAAPEVLSGKACDQRSDVFSLGATLYYLASGEHPFGKSSIASVLAAQQNPPRRLTQRMDDVPLWFDSLVMSCLKHDPNQRPEDGLELLQLFEAGPRRRTWLIVVVSILVMVLVLAGALVWMLAVDS